MDIKKLWPWRSKPLAEELQLTSPIDSALVTNTMLLEFMRERRSDRNWLRIKRFLFAFVLLSGFLMSFYMVLRANNAIPPSGERGYSVGTVYIRGVIGDGSGSAEMVLPALRRAFEDRNTDTIILRIDSPGGSPSEAERIYSEVERLKAKHHKKVEAVIDNLGASAAYLIAIHTDRITASQYSLVGSVGAIMHTWNAATLAEKVGVVQQAYASGTLKDMGNPTRVPTAEEKAKGVALVSGIAAVFAQDVKTHRGERLKITEAALTTGEAWSGLDAKNFGLVDDLGTMEGVLARMDAKSRNFGPFQRTIFGDTFAQWSREVGAAMVDGAMSRLTTSAQGAPWRTE